MNGIVLSLGGSLVVPDKPDTNYLSQFERFIRTNLDDRQFYIIVGGGKTARHYIDAAALGAGAGGIEDEDKDWLGIHATHLNAHLLRTIFRDIARPVLIQDPKNKIRTNRPVVVGGGYRPGNSTDWVATMVATTNNVKRIINLTNIDYVYDKDPRRFRDAKPIERISWKEYIGNISGDKWTPGMNVPFDPIASKLAHEKGLTVVIADGHNLENLADILNGRKYVGTTIC